MDWPQAIWSRWISFEERYGTIEQLSAAHLKVAGLSDALAKRMAEVSIADHQHFTWIPLAHFIANCVVTDCCSVHRSTTNRIGQGPTDDDRRRVRKATISKQAQNRCGESQSGG